MNKQRRGGYYPPAKKIWGLILIMSMLCAFTPCIHAAEIVDSGTCGANVTWTLDDEGTLTISGTGGMDDYSDSDDIPWRSNKESVKTAVINSGVTNISDNAFYRCASLTSVIIPDSVTSIGDWAFYRCYSLTDIYYSGSEEDWKNISIDDHNEYLTNAAIHAAPVPIPTTTAEITKSETSEAYTFTIVPEKAYTNCYVYAAIYDADGALLSVSRVPLNETGSTSVLADKSDSDALAKVFIWADTLQSIIEKAKEFPLV